MKEKTILVSGASGFLGKELVRQLLENENHYTVALTSKVESLYNFFGRHPKLMVLDINEWKNHIQEDFKIDVLINCAFPRSSHANKLAEGLSFTANLIQDAIDLNIRSIINISSQSVYSQKEKTLPNENAEVAPETLYGMAKYASEKLVTILCKNANYNISYSNIRLASLTGIELDARMTNKFVKMALSGEQITVNGRGQKISYLDVRDAARALITMAIHNKGNWNTVYNLGNFHYSSVLELAEIVKEVAVKHLHLTVDIKVIEKQDNFNNLIDSSLFYKKFQWSPFYDNYLMIEDLFEFYRNNK